MNHLSPQSTPAPVPDPQELEQRRAAVEHVMAQFGAEAKSASIDEDPNSRFIHRLKVETLSDHQ